jgi:RNA polymerase sigma-70 factor (ECF subfamily)
MKRQPQGSNVADRQFAEFMTSGSQDALSDALLSAGPELMERARRLTGDAEGAMDLVQATFLAAIESCARFDRERRFVPWLIGILENLHRYGRRRQARTVDAERIAPPDDHDPVEIVHDKLLREAIDAAVAGLPSPYHEVVTRYLHDQMPPEEIARSLGRSPSTVRTQLWRGLRLMRTRLPAGLVLSAWALVASSAAAAECNGTPATDGGASTIADPQAHAMRRLALRRHSTLLRLSFALVMVCGLLGIGLWFGAAHDPLPALAVAQAGGSAAAVSGALTQHSTDPADRQPVTTAAAPTARVRVRMRWESDGSPAAGQSLRLSTGKRGTSLLQNWFAHVRTEWSDEHGEVTFDDVPHGHARLLIDDALVSTVLTVSGEGVEQEITLAPTARIEGEVVDADGQPVAGADIWLSSTQGQGSPGYVATRANAEGRFVYAALSPTWDIWATAPGQGCSFVHRDANPTLVSRPRLVLTGPALSLRGAVVDGAGQPVAGATVGVFPRKKTTVPAGSGFLPPQYEVASRDGRFAFAHLPRGRFFAVVRDTRHCACLEELELVEPDQLVQLVLDREGATIRGRVSVPPDPDASLVVYASPVKAVARTGLNGLIGSVALVAPDLTFELHHVYPGPVEISVRGRRHGVSVGVEHRSLTAANDETVEVELGERRLLRGRVVDEQGTAVADVTVAALPADCDWRDFYNPLVVGVTDTKGEFRLALANDLPHVCEIREGPPGQNGFAWTMSPPCEAGPDPVELTLPSRRAPGTLRGILSPEWPSKTELHLMQLPMCQRLQLFVDRDGRFELDHLPPGRFSLIALLAGKGAYHEVAAFDLASGQALQLGPIAVPATGILAVTVEKADGAQVQLSRPIGVARVANPTPVEGIRELDSRGHGELRVGPGEYQVHVACRDALPITRKVTVSAGQTTTLPILVQPLVPCVFRLQPPVHVVTARAVLQISDQHGIRLVREIVALGDRGYFEFAIGLPAGPAHVRAVTDRGKTVATEIQVEAGPAPAVFALQLR